MNKIKELYLKYKEIINYLIFGVLTTLVNILGYAFLAKVLKINYMVSNVTALTASIIFAYVTNKLFVFESKKTGIKEILKEIVSFFACRGITAIMDIALMFVTVSMLHFNDMIMKILVNVLVIVLNYVFSKLFIFKKEDTNKKEVKEKKTIYDYIVSFFKILAGIITGIFGFASLNLTAYFKANFLDWNFHVECFGIPYDPEKIFYKWDYIIELLFGLLIVSIIGFVIIKVWQKLKINNRAVVIGFIILSMIVCSVMVLKLKIFPKADQWHTYTAAISSIQNIFDDFENENYLNVYPHQIGLVFYFELLLRLFNTKSFVIIQLFNVMELAVTFWFMYLCIEKLIKNDLGIKVSTLLMFGFAPIYFYTNFVYGNIPGLMFSIISIYYMLSYFENKKIYKLVISTITISAAIVIRSNYLIFFIAESICYFIHAIKEKDYKLILVILFAFILNKGAFKVIEKYYEIRSGIQVSKGVPKTAWVAMGMQEGTRAEGWYNGYNYYGYFRNGCDYDKTMKANIGDIKTSLKKFINNPRYTLDFYSRKNISQWCEPTFASQWIIEPWGNNEYYFRARNSKILTSFFAGRLNKIYDIYCETILVLIYISVTYVIFKKMKKVELKDIVFLIVFLGGVAFHMLWEGKSQYTWIFVFCLIPYVGLAFTPKNEKLQIKEKN